MLSNRKRSLTIVGALLILTGCGGGGGGGPPPPTPAPTVSFAASATDVQTNGAVTLSWSSTNATSCSASGGWSGSLATSGSKSQPVAATSTFTVTCTGTGGSGSGSATVTAWNAPAPAITADQTDILSNNSVVLTWSSQNATTCSGADGLSGSLATSGAQTSASLTTTSIFSVSCSNPAFTAVKASITVNVSPTFTASVIVQYQVPGAPVVNAARTHYVPDWGHPVTHPVPFVWVEMQDPAGNAVRQAYADANGVATLAGLDSNVMYTPVVRSKISDPAHGLDFVVLDNTAPVDTSQPAYRARYPEYANAASTYTPDKRLSIQSVGTVTAPDGWNATSSSLDDSKRFAAPYALLANAVYEAQIVTSATGGSPVWRPLTILWSTQNKGGLAAPPNQLDQGFVTGSGGYYGASHAGVDSSGLETGASVAEDLEFISGDQTTEAMDIYPFVLTHEMGHFTQSLFSTKQSPGGSHSYDDYEDPTQAWIEGSASGIAALALKSPLQNRVGTIAGELVVGVDDPSTYTINGNPQSWPLGWYQEAAITQLMWKLYDPGGAIKLPAATVLAPTYTAAWKAGPWLNTAWAYTAQLAKLNPSNATVIASLGDSLNIRSTGDDEWGATETHPGDRTTQDAIPPYTSVSIGGGPVTVCSAGAPNDYNKEGNVRYLRVTGDGTSHNLTVTGPTGTVPVLSRRVYAAGSNVLAGAITFPLGVTAVSLGDCAIALSSFSTDTAACTESTLPPIEQCWTVSLQ